MHSSPLHYLIRLQVDVPQHPSAGAPGDLLDGTAVLLDLDAVGGEASGVWAPALVIDDQLAANLTEQTVDPFLDDEAVLVEDMDRHLTSDRLGSGDPRECWRPGNDRESLTDASGGFLIDPRLGGERAPERFWRRGPRPTPQHARAPDPRTPVPATAANP